MLVNVTGPRNLSLSWSVPDADQQNGIIRNYLIYIIPRVSWLQATRYVTSVAQTCYAIQELHPFSSYHISVAAVTIGPGPNSTVVLVQTEEDGMETYLFTSVFLYLHAHAHSSFGCSN